MDTSVIFLLPVILFIVTLLLIFILRAKDKQQTKLPMVKKMAEQTIGQIEKINAQFKQDITDIEVQMTDKENSLKENIQTITRQIKELDSYAEDLARLRNSMNKYQEALAGIVKLTNDADMKVQAVEDSIHHIDDVAGRIEAFRARVQELESGAQSIVDASLGRIEAAMNNADQVMQQYLSELDSKINDTQAAINILEDNEAKAEVHDTPKEESVQEIPEIVPDTEQEPVYVPEIVPDTEQEPEVGKENEGARPEEEKVQYTGEEEEVVFD